MRYLLFEDFQIINDDASFAVGRVQPTTGREGPYRVFASVTGYIEVATVHSLEECVTALADYYEKNPPRWARRSAGLYEKETLYSTLRVEQDQGGRWRVYRDGFPLLEGRGYSANFREAEEGKRAADIHMLDGFPNAKSAADDGYWWVLDPDIDWRSLPEDVELRARWKPLASLWRPDVMEAIR